MKINWKVLVALGLMIGDIAWTVNWTRSTSYSGTDLTFEVGSGTVTMTNPSNDPVPAQLMSPSTRSFTVSSEIEDMPRSSIRSGTTPNIISLLEFELPSGESAFTLTRGSDVSFVANTDTPLEATLQAANYSTKIQALGVFMLVALFYISHTTEHRWIYKLLGREPASKLHSKPYTGEPY